MFRRTRLAPATQPAVPAADAHDVCFRCGRPTPLGVSLCEHDNPGGIKAPSSTQVHGTIALGVIAGFVLFILLLTFSARGLGQFNAAVTGTATQPDGSVELVVSVTNTGDKPSAASCRVSSAGTPNASDAIFLSQPIPVGETRTFSRMVTLPAGVSSAPASFVVRCN
jgi:hypothetical protein